MEQAQPEAATASPPTCSWTDHFTGSCKLIIKNASGKRVQLVWLSYDGTEHIYNVLEDGQETQQETFSTHVWELRDEDGVCILQYAGPSAKLHILQTGASVVGISAAATASTQEATGSGS